MPSFVDIVPLTEEVSLRGVDFEVRGLTMGDLGRLFYRFPALRKLLPAAAALARAKAAASLGTDVPDPAPERPFAFDAEQLVALGPEVCAALIAAAAGKKGAKEEAAIAALGIAELLAFVGPIVRLTFPQGLVPFISGLTALATGVGESASGGLDLGKAPASG